MVARPNLLTLIYRLEYLQNQTNDTVILCHADQISRLNVISKNFTDLPTKMIHELLSILIAP